MRKWNYVTFFVITTFPTHWLSKRQDYGSDGRIIWESETKDLLCKNWAIFDNFNALRCPIKIYFLIFPAALLRG